MNVVFRVDFEEATLKSFKKYTDQIAQHFPIKEQKDGFRGRFSLDIESGNFDQERKEIVAWMFYDSEKTKKIEITNTYIALQFFEGQYTDSAQLLTDISNVFVPFLQMFDIKQLLRVGLRYQNVIKLKENNPLDWEKYINPNLLGAIKFTTDKKLTTARSMGQLVVKFDEADVIVNHGIWNDDFPNAINRKEFILDLDCYSKFPLVVADSDIQEIAKSYNAHVNLLFESLITDDFRTHLNA